MERDSLLNISPIDGRYTEITKSISDYFSEYGYIKYRVKIECEWLKYIIKNILKEKVNKEDIDNIYISFTLEDTKRVKEIENTTNHDVKAIEYYVREKLENIGLNKYISFVHFACTSEDINNLAQSLMIKECINNVVNTLIEKLVQKVKIKAEEYSDISMLAHTHGQPATPTTMGKELAVFVYRWKRLYEKMKEVRLLGKFSGAVGNFGAHYVAYNDINWINVSKEFIESLGLEYNPLTTQIESHDSMCELLSYIKLFNNVTLDYNSDMWMYISFKYFKQKTVATETGSSVMPHKVNPINHENSMANIHICNGLIDSFTNNLQISRMQRDLSDSSTIRNIGVIFSHMIISINQTIKGIDKMEINEEILKEDLINNPEVLAEAIQTILRKNGYTNAYEMLKEMTRGKRVTIEEIRDFISNLDINLNDKQELLNLDPLNYIGLSKELIKFI